MLELFYVFLRYVLVAYGTHLVATGNLDQSVLEPLVGAGMALAGFLWMLISNGYVKRFITYVKSWFK